MQGMAGQAGLSFFRFRKHKQQADHNGFVDESQVKLLTDQLNWSAVVKNHHLPAEKSQVIMQNQMSRQTATAFVHIPFFYRTIDDGIGGAVVL
jgi:hypothetical protein